MWYDQTIHNNFYINKIVNEFSFELQLHKMLIYKNELQT